MLVFFLSPPGFRRIDNRTDNMLAIAPCAAPAFTVPLTGLGIPELHPVKVPFNQGGKCFDTSIILPGLPALGADHVFFSQLLIFRISPAGPIFM